MPKREQRLIRALELLHVGAHRVETLHRVLDAERQVEEDQAEAVAELPRLFRRSQVYRHERTHRDAGDSRRLDASRYERSAPATDDSSTSLTEQSSARPMALISASGSVIGPRHALGDAGLALEARA